MVGARALGRIVVALLVVAAVLPVPTPAMAGAVFVVTTTAEGSDIAPGNGICDNGLGQCTLRAAVEEANALAGADTITLPAGAYTVTARLDVDEDLQVNGAGRATTSIHTSVAAHGFWADEFVTLSLSGITFSHVGGGWACVAAGPLLGGHTGEVGVSVDASSFEGCTIGIMGSSSGPAHVQVVDSEFSGGQSAVQINTNGGSLSVDMTTFDSFTHDVLKGAFGTGDATVAVVDSSFVDNADGGVWVSASAPHVLTTTITDTSFEAVEDFAVHIDAPAGSATVSGVTISRGAALYGGGIHSSSPITVSNTTVKDVVSRGIWIFYTSAVIERVEVSGTSDAGIEWVGDGGESLTIADSTVAHGGDGVYGILLTSYGSPGSDSVAIVNSTVVGMAHGLAVGGPAGANYPVDVTNSTITNNDYYGIETVTDSVTVTNTIVHGNAIADCSLGWGAAPTSCGHNLIGDGTCGFAATGDLSSVDPLLGALADNGGPTRTMALAGGSPAIDSGDDLACPGADQRGIKRPLDGNGDSGAQCDIGAYEALFEPFTDDDGSTFEDEIEWLYQQGIAYGCGPRLFCPGDPVSRGQMASFLARALSLPASTKDWFTDDDGNTHEANINKLADAGITLGLGGGLYDPDGFVTRAQMASFLARAFSLPTSVTNWFVDDDGSTHEQNINRLADSGITLGCSGADPTIYCPANLVTRGQMAAFLYRGLAP